MKINFDSRFFLVFKRIGDIVLLQLLFLVTSLPVVTIGAGIAALFDVSKKLQKDAVSFVIPTYWEAFKGNLKKATLAWLLLLAVAALMYFDYTLCTAQAPAVSTALFVIFLILAIVIYLIYLYTFPLLAWFDNSLSAHYKNALILAVGNLGTTILATLILAVAAFIAIVALPLFALIGCSGTVYILSILFSRIMLPADSDQK